jgi:VanZ family protein
VEQGRVERSGLHLDKLVHLAAFAGFGLLWKRVSPGRRTGIMILAAGALLAIISELGQAMPVVGREPDVLDAIADVLGVLIGICASNFLKQKTV